MKKTSSPFVFGAFVVACLAAVRCGGDDSGSSTPNGSSGSTANAGGASGAANAGGAAGDATAGTPNAGGANTAGTPNAGGANNGGANNGGGGVNTAGTNVVRDGGGGTMMGGGGTTQVGGDAGMCPAMTPMNGDMCTGNVVCLYPTQQATQDRRCSCGATGPRGDGGVRAREFTCFNVPAPRDAGGMPGADAGGIDRCANGVNGGDNCNMPGTVCRIDQNSFCSCLTIANETQWFCN